MLHKPRLILTLLLLISAIAILYGQNEAVALADTSAV
jgi:hypothetical protein